MTRLFYRYDSLLSPCVHTGITLRNIRQIFLQSARSNYHQ